METKAMAWPDGFGSAQKTIVYNTHTPDYRAAFALELMSKFAIIACKFDGEDSAGRQKMEEITAGDLVSRACDIADSAFREFNTRGWLVETPAPIPAETEDERACRLMREKKRRGQEVA